jgi:RHS repeat-associated protein
MGTTIGTYAYNAIGNITSKTVGGNTFTYSYSASHKHAVSSITYNGTPYNYSYDNNGNMTSGPDFTNLASIQTRTSITYNADNMPTQIVHSSNGTTELTYGGTGERVKKRVYSGGTVTDTYYIGDHFEVKGGETIKYIFAGNLRVAQVKGTTRSFFHKDHLGSSTVMTDASGYELEYSDYAPFGSQRVHTGTNTSDYRYTDQELDAENGLYNYNARLYDPFIGRFISADTIIPEPFNPQSLNRYSYCLNNPLIYVDPSGHVQKKKGDDEETLDTIYVWGVKVPDPFTLWNDIWGEIPPWIEAQQIKLQMEFEAMIASLYGGGASKNVVRKKIPKNGVRMKIPKPIGVDSGEAGSPNKSETTSITPLEAARGLESGEVFPCNVVHYEASVVAGYRGPRYNTTTFPNGINGEPAPTSGPHWSLKVDGAKSESDTLLWRGHHINFSTGGESNFGYRGSAGGPGRISDGQNKGRGFWTTLYGEPEVYRWVID